MDMEILRVSDNEYYHASAERLANEANNSREYGVNRLTPAQLKSIFMRATRLLTDKHNDLVAILDGLDELGMITKDSVLGVINTGIPAMPTLYDLLVGMRDNHGTWIDTISAGNGETLHEFLDGLIQTIDDRFKYILNSLGWMATFSINDDGRYVIDIVEHDDGMRPYDFTVDSDGRIVLRSQFSVETEPAPGAPGKSAYEIAVERGYVGSEDEWLASLHGKNGDPGRPGEKGEKGDDGFSPSARVERTFTGVKISVTDKQGTTEAEVHDGQGGGGDVTKSYVDGEISKVSETVIAKLDKPTSAPTVGKILKVKSVNADGTFVCEWADDEMGDVNDVQIDGESILSDGVANIPLASSTTKGVVGVYAPYGINIFNGDLTIQPLESKHIDGRVHGSSTSGGNRPLTIENLDYAVKAAMCDGMGAEWTDEEKASARERMDSEQRTWDVLFDETLTESARRLCIDIPTGYEHFRFTMSRNDNISATPYMRFNNGHPFYTLLSNWRLGIGYMGRNYAHTIGRTSDANYSTSYASIDAFEPLISDDEVFTKLLVDGNTMDLTIGTRIRLEGKR